MHAAPGVGRRVWKTVASAESANADEAHARASVMLAAIRRGGDAPDSSEILFEAAADEVFTRYARNWKPGTLKVNRDYFCNHILPRFRGRPIADIDRTEVRQWFTSLHAKPASADRSLTTAEIGSLVAVLRRLDADRPQQVAIIKLLLLTGCRAGEVRRCFDCRCVRAPIQ